MLSANHLWDSGHGRRQLAKEIYVNLVHTIHSVAEIAPCLILQLYFGDSEYSKCQGGLGSS